MRWRHRPFTLESAEAVAAGVPTMMKPPELDLLYSVAKHQYTGAGAIVDAGIFMGASTICFAEGLKANSDVPEKENRIQSYERATVTPAMSNFKALDGFAVGSSYESLLRERLASYQEYVTLHLGDIVAQQWPGDQPIEILFLDILKSNAVMNHCNRMFLPALIPGKSLILHQDFFWPFGWWLNAWMERWSSYFEVVDFAESTVAFRLKEKLPNRAFDRNLLNNTPVQTIRNSLEHPKIAPFRVDHFLAQKLTAVHYLLDRVSPAAAKSAATLFAADFADILQNRNNSDPLKRLYNDFNRLNGMIKRALSKEQRGQEKSAEDGLEKVQWTRDLTTTMEHRGR